MFLIIALFAATCPIMKSNIMPPYNKKDMEAYMEWKITCLNTKAFPCLVEFIKKEDGFYRGVCSAPLPDNR